MSVSLYLHVCVDHEVQAIEVKVADFALQLVFDTVEAVQHDPLHLFLGGNQPVDYSQTFTYQR